MTHSMQNSDLSLKSHDCVPFSGNLTSLPLNILVFYKSRDLKHFVPFFLDREILRAKCAIGAWVLHNS